jgi:glutaminyl-tRNA synthetase
MSEEKSLNFIEEFIEDDLKTGKHDSIQTRFPPEPNGYLHIGHASSIVLNFGLKEKYNGKCNLRFDDTNPVTEETEFVESIKNDIKWLGFEWDKELYTSDYFETLYGYAVKLIEKGLAYVDDSTAEEMASMKGTPTSPGKNNQYRDRSIEENLKLFKEMREGKYKDGEKALRAKIDMAHDNMLMRDPIIYRIKHVDHHRTGSDWCIYPMYDFAHGQSDSIENVTHSLCTLEFLPHRPFYNWCIEKLEIFPSRQIEFARRNMTYTVMSKRRLKQLVEDKHVTGWDDPRMPTISGLRRRGYTANSIKCFSERTGIAKRDNIVDIGLLDFCLRDDLNKIAQRRMAVLDPIKVVILNYEEGKTEKLIAQNNPEREEDGSRELNFSREIFIERADFMEEPPKKFFRLGPGLKTRLKHAYIIECVDFKKDESGKVTELHCNYFKDSKSGEDVSGIKVKGVIHWVNCDDAIDAEVRLYDRLFKVENPMAEDGDFKEYINEDSLEIISNAKIEPALAEAEDGEHFQFLRKGYFIKDQDSTVDKIVFNRAVGLRDSWAKKNKK